MKSVVILSQTYKVGLRGKVFVEVDDEWISSNNFTAFEVEQAILDHERKEREKLEKRRERERAKRARSSENQEGGEDIGQQYQTDGSSAPVPVVCRDGQ